jgi:hypothetical protein
MSERAIKEALILAEEDIVSYTENLAEWFRKGREIPEAHTGECVVEKMYMATMLANITKSFDEVEFLTKQLADFRKDLF